MRTPRTAGVEETCVMLNCCVYFLKPDGHIHSPPQIFACANDADAEEQSRQLLEGNVIEVWQHTRLVAVLTPDKTENRLP
jgi:hypothetical protein